MQLNTDDAVHYHTGQFPPVKLDLPVILPSLLQATDALARYDQMLKGMHNSEIFLAPLRNQEAVISSRMEGTISTMDEILQLDAELDPESTSGETRSEALETILYQRTLRAAQQQMAEGYPLSASLIRSMHQQLLSIGRGAGKSPGKFKTQQNYIGERGSGRVEFVPIAPEVLLVGLDQMLHVMQDKQRPILLRAALCHLEFEALHPFEDGNGRVGRMLITLMLWADGSIAAPHFYISRYLEDHKDVYLHQMREVSRSGQWEDWCCFFLEAVRQQALHNLESAESIRSLYEEMKLRFQQVLASKFAQQALDFVFTWPVFRNSRFTQHAGIPSATASRFSRVLLKEGLLETVQESAGQKAALLRFEPLMRRIRV
ncbi:MAG: Fic/DOC family N-terminal domain-containing protein [Candidatus Delongbacteria bacterium]